ncbi:MAG: adenylosuccinate lyase [Gammaproteobacteria bacterium]
MSIKSLPVLTALSPTDGRYAKAGDPLRPFFSEFGLIRYRVLVELRWLEFLAASPDIPDCEPLSESQLKRIRRLADGFTLEDAQRIKDIEATTNHDVKAVEYFLREQLQEAHPGSEQSRFVHFACTSEDINNLAYALAVRDANREVVVPTLSTLCDEMARISERYRSTPMLSRTHGQTASPTTLGKEVKNVTARLSRQIEQLTNCAVLGKLNGAVGNFNAHLSAYPKVDWPSFGTAFVSSLDLTPNPFTTQIEPHDWMAEYFHALSRANTVLSDWCKDVWGYISLGYFTQVAVEGEVGSSTMPHKINPIQFENAEGNLGLANALLGHLAGKLPVSRWQRDLTDSTVLRNIGVAVGWSVVAYSSVSRGMSRMGVNEERLNQDLDSAWEVLAEPIQTVMKRHGIEDAYEQLKALTRGQAITQESLAVFITTLDIPEEARAELARLTPQNYIGCAEFLASHPEPF